MYRLYAQKHEGSYEKITEKKTANEIEKVAGRLKASQYYSYLIIENNGEGDSIYQRQVLSEPVKIEKVDKDKTDIEINAFSFHTDKKNKIHIESKAKRKQNFMKEIREYL